LPVKEEVKKPVKFEVPEEKKIDKGGGDFPLYKRRKHQYQKKVHKDY